MTVQLETIFYYKKIININKNLKRNDQQSFPFTLLS